MADQKFLIPRMNIFETVGLLFHSIISNLFNANMPGGRAWLYGSNKMKPNALPELESVIDMALKKEISQDRYYNFTSAYGYNKEMSDHILLSAKNYLEIFSYVTLYRRKEITLDQLKGYMSKLHLEPGEVDNILKSSEFFPAPGDLVRFAVREVYSPEVAQKFGLFEDLPQKFISESSKSGLPEEQARNFWAAHWELPSPLQGFQMLHRRIIDEDTLKLLLKALDVMPFWRDKMVQLSHNPLTRVDVRRMYGLGVIDEQGVYNAYLDVGYSAENAELMTTFTTRYENNENDGITRSNILKAYKEDLIERDELISYLQLLDYSDKVVTFWVDMADYEKTEARIKLITNDAIELYRLGEWNIVTVRNELLKQDLPAKYVDRIIQESVIQQAKRRKVPTKSDLETWLNSQIITEDYYTTKMRLIGYSDKDIQFYLSEIALKVDTSKIKLLPLKTYSRWLTKEIITEEVFRVIAKELKISDIDTDRLVSEALPIEELPESAE